MIRPQWTSVKLDRSLLTISDEVLADRAARITPLILRHGHLFDFETPASLRSTSFTMAPQGLVKVPDERAYREVARTQTQHSCGYHAFFKPSISEVLAQIPDDPTITAFYLDTSTVVILDQGEGHLCTCHWLTNASVLKNNG